VESQNPRQATRLNYLLFREGKSFDFYQAVGLLNELAKSTGRKLKFSARLSQSFSATDIDQIIKHKDYDELVANFLSLVTPDSPLPNYYIENLLADLENDNTTVKDFLDVFHQRLYELLFAIRNKYRLKYQLTQTIADNKILRIINNMTGLNFTARSHFVEEQPALTQYARFFIAGNRTLTNLQYIINDYFQIQTRIESFHKQSIQIHPQQRNRLGVSKTTLSKTLYLGEVFTSVSSNILLHVPVTTHTAINNFMPNGIDVQKLRYILILFCTKPIHCFLRLIINPQLLTQCTLGTKIFLGQTVVLGGERSSPLSVTFQIT
jgi:type VI secretion system protein ImpH